MTSATNRIQRGQGGPPGTSTVQSSDMKSCPDAYRHISISVLSSGRKPEAMAMPFRKIDIPSTARAAYERLAVCPHKATQLV